MKLADRNIGCKWYVQPDGEFRWLCSSHAEGEQKPHPRIVRGWDDMWCEVCSRLCITCNLPTGSKGYLYIGEGYRCDPCEQLTRSQPHGMDR